MGQQAIEALGAEAAAAGSAHDACPLAGIRPDEADFSELHDAFGIAAALSLEVCRFAPRGGGSASEVTHLLRALL